MKQKFNDRLNHMSTLQAYLDI